MRRVTGTLPAVFALATLAACAGTRRPDAHVNAPALVSVVRSSLERDGRVASATSVSVDARTGAVRLSGRVASAAERETAGRLASSVKGVTLVYNELEVQPLSAATRR
jgi:osmotically-inducible protein OsmY